MSDEPEIGLQNLSFDSVARYTILEEIGRGGMGIVFLAERGSEGVTENIVLKTIRDISSEREQELRQEANIATRLRHPNILRTYGLESVPVSRLPARLRKELTGMGKQARPKPSDSADDLYSTSKRRARRVRRRGSGSPKRREPRGREQRRQSNRQMAYYKPDRPDDTSKMFFLLMEYVDGVDLLGLHLEHLKKGTLIPVQFGAYIVSRVARALEYAHKSIIHRDVSAENVMIDDQGIPLLSDFGIAVGTDTAQETRAGKLTYLAPEVLGGDPADERADLYALGLTAVLIASGITYQMVPKADTRQEQYAIIRDLALRGWPALHEVMNDIPPEYSRIIAKMIEPDPEMRYARAQTVANEIEQEVLYGSGFGATSNSLANYIDIFEGDFEEYDDAQLETLAFLRDDDGQLTLRRDLSYDLYSKAGRRMVDARGGSSLGRALTALPKKKTHTSVVDGRPVLKVRFGDNCLETVHCEGVIEIGRSELCQIVVPDSQVSRKHGRVRVTPQGPLVEDVGSGNGVILDGEKIELAMLREGSHFKIGRTSIYFLHEPRVLPPEKVVRIEAEKLPEPSKLDRSELPILILGKDRGGVRGLWDSLAKINGFAERAECVFSQALTELIGLIAGEDDGLRLQILRDRSRLRIYIHTPTTSDRLEQTLNLFKQLASRGEVELDTETGDYDSFDLAMDTQIIAAMLVRNVFDRIDFHVRDSFLLLSKSF